MSPEEIKQAFFHCSHKNPEGFYADEVDIIEFGQKIEEFVLAQRKPMPEEDIVDFMLNSNLKGDGTLLDRITTVIREVEAFHGIK